MSLRDYIRREIDARDEFMIGTVMSRKRWVLFDDSAAGAQTLVVDVDIGNRTRFLKDVPVKAGANGSRFYAGIGQTVRLQSNAHGRWDVVGPSSQRIANTNVCIYDMSDRSLVSMAMEGFLFERVPFAFYMGSVRARWAAAAETAEFFTTGTKIVRSAGSWVSDGFTVDTKVTIGGTSLNNGDKGEPSSVSALEMAFASGIVDESPVANCPIMQTGPSASIPGAGNANWANGTTTFNLILQTDADGNLV